MITIAFYKGRTRLFNRLVSWWTRGIYSHCELLYNPTLQLKDGKQWVCSSSHADKGVRIQEITWHAENWDLVTIEGNCGEAVEWFRRHLGEPYDVPGLAGFVARRVRHSKRRWFCSEACAEAIGMPESWRFDPNTLHAALSLGAVHPPR